MIILHIKGQKFSIRQNKEKTRITSVSKPNSGTKPKRYGFACCGSLRINTRTGVLMERNPDCVQCRIEDLRSKRSA
jgi:hypothetical protein